MLFVNNETEINFVISNHKINGKTIGFVPTMGALHEGHIALIKRAKKENDIVVCSIYVNPLQFNNNEDFNLYPRLLEQDCTMLEEAGCDIVYVPDKSILDKSNDFKYNIGYLDEIMEGKFRPGHFNGVAFIVKKFFEIVKPHKAYFGEKDYQQLAVVKKMTKDFNLAVEVIPCQTVREADGLALSSRNKRLSEEERSIAPKIFEGLNFIKNNIYNFTFEQLKVAYITLIEESTPIKVEYIEICDAESLKILTNLAQASSLVVCTAVYLGNVRLIDNIKINL